jgi:hypothetical protein
LTLLAILASIVFLGLSGAGAAAYSKHRRLQREVNSAFHRALLEETEARLVRFHTAPQAGNS